MSASMIVLALAAATVAELPRNQAISAGITVRGFVPASCRAMVNASVGCNAVVVTRLAPALRDSSRVIVVTPLH
jgi:hypothetical protein